MWRMSFCWGVVVMRSLGEELSRNSVNCVRIFWVFAETVRKSGFCWIPIDRFWIPIERPIDRIQLAIERLVDRSVWRPIERSIDRAVNAAFCILFFFFFFMSNLYGNMIYVLGYWGTCVQHHSYCFDMFFQLIMNYRRTNYVMIVGPKNGDRKSTRLNSSH